MWTMDNTEGFSQDQLDDINELRGRLLTEASEEENSQFAMSLNDRITNEWPADDLEAAVRKHLGM